jgi:putative component of toxin-antitoxin plasmid stabilization module
MNDGVLKKEISLSSRRGPGYSVYFIGRDEAPVALLSGGNKQGQSRYHG